jgi:hypothetical protein
VGGGGKKKKKKKISIVLTFSFDIYAFSSLRYSGDFGIVFLGHTGRPKITTFPKNVGYSNSLACSFVSEIGSILNCEY